MNSIKMDITIILKELGVPANLLGFKYVRKAIELCIEDANIIYAVTKCLYPAIAKEFKTTTSKVDRAIRHAVETSWDRGDLDMLDKMFCYTYSANRGKPTNSEFIATIADYLVLMREEANSEVCSNAKS